MVNILEKIVYKYTKNDSEGLEITRDNVYHIEQETHWKVFDRPCTILRIYEYAKFVLAYIDDEIYFYNKGTNVNRRFDHCISVVYDKFMYIFYYVGNSCNVIRYDHVNICREHLGCYNKKKLSLTNFSEIFPEYIKKLLGTFNWDLLEYPLKVYEKYPRVTQKNVSGFADIIISFAD